MWYFDFFSSSCYKLLQIKRKALGGGAKFFRYLAAGVLVLGFLLWGLSKFGTISPVTLSLALFLIGASSLFYFYQALIFFKFLRITPLHTLQTALSLSKREKINLAEVLDLKASNLILRAYQIAGERKRNPSPLDLLLALHSSPLGQYILVRADMVSSPKVKELIQDSSLKEPPKSDGVSPALASIVKGGLELAKSEGAHQISDSHLLLAAFKGEPLFKKLLFELDLEYSDLENIIGWFKTQEALQKRVPFWKPAPLRGIGEDWSYGYTPILNRFGRDLTRAIELAGEVHPFGRIRELESIERILAKSGENNVILIGEHGVGKKTTVKGFVSKIIRGEVLPSLQDKQVFEIDVGAVLAGAGQKGEVEARLKRILYEAIRAGNVILFIDDIHALFSSRPSEAGQINASEIFIPYLKRSDIQVIGTTTYKELHRDIEANPGIASAFEKIEVGEPSKENVLKILEEVIPRLEFKNKTVFTYQALEEAILVAERFMHDIPFPEKAIELLDEVAVKAGKLNQKVVRKYLIDQVAEEKTQVPVEQAVGAEKEKLLNLEEVLHRRVINQDEAIKAIANAMRRARAGLKKENRPIGSFLFLGPTGVGKTETAKTLAAAYFGSEKNMLRFDMSEFQEASSLYRLIGAPPGAGKEGSQGELTTAVRESPFSLILLDELEKTHPQILTLFLQVLDDGRLTDGTGRTVDFTNCIIIATSNAGAELIRGTIKKAGPNIDNEALRVKLLDYLQTQGIFRPEFLNRFDGIISFHPLTPELIKKIALLMIKKLNVSLKEKEIEVELTPRALEKLIEVGFDPVYGARPMQRAIQEKVENLVADRLLRGEVARGSKVLIEEKDIVASAS